MALDPQQQYLENQLNKLDVKLDTKFDSLTEDIAELKVLVATATATHAERIESHGRELYAQGKRVGSLEGRQWQQLGAITLGVLSFAGTLVLFIFTLL